MKILSQVLLTLVSLICANCEEEIQFLYNEFEFNESFATIAWTQPLECLSIDNYRIIISNMFGTSTNRSDVGVRTSVTLSRDLLSPSFFMINRLFVEVYSNITRCAFTEISVQIPGAVNFRRLLKFPAEDICIQPSSLQLTIIWATSENASCSCNFWYSISRCSCAVRNNSTLVYNEVDSMENPKICWKNLSIGSKIYAVSESFNDLSVVNFFPQVNQEIFESYIVFLAGIPDPPIVTKNDEELFSLCFAVNYNGNSPIIQYNVMISDQTGFSTDMRVMASSSKTCGVFQALNSGCGPFNVTVTSQNLVGVSNLTSVIINDNDKTQICTCFIDNVAVNFTILSLKEPRSPRVQINCKTQYILISEIKVLVQLKEKYGGVVNTTTAKCFEIIQYQSLKYSTSYEISIFWLTSEENECQLHFSDNILNTGEETPLSPGVIVAILLIPMLLIMCSVVMVIFVWVRILKKGYKRDRKSWNIKHSEETNM